MSAKSISKKGVLEVFEIVAFTGNKKEGTRKEVGRGNVTCFSELPDDLPKVRALITVQHIVKLNRQLKTDKRNSLATIDDAKKVLKALDTISEVFPALKALADKLSAQIKADKVDKVFLKSLETKLATLDI